MIAKLNLRGANTSAGPSGEPCGLRLRGCERAPRLLADYAWRALSAACHHHPYDLPPNVDEIRRLIKAVAAIRQRLKPRSA